MKKTLAYITVAVMLIVLLGGCQVKTGTVPGVEVPGGVEVMQKPEAAATTDAAAAVTSETVAPTEPKPTEAKPTEPKTTTATTAPTEPKPTEPKATEPVATEPKATEPKATEPKPTEPKATEPVVTEPKPTEPKPTEPKATEPVATEPKATEPKATEPKPTEPKPTEPKPTEPVPTVPTTTEPPHECEYYNQLYISPTCTEDGYSVYVCKICRDRYTEPLPACHDWYLYEMSAQGHYEVYPVCKCGWTTEFTDGADWDDKWAAHRHTYDTYEMLREHGNWGDAHRWVIDVPAHDEWHCLQCNAVSLTDPT